MQKYQSQSPANSLIKPALIGGVIALVLIGIFLAGVNNPNPEWPKYWLLQPLMIVPIAGASGGIFFYVVSRIFRAKGWNKFLSLLLGLAGYIFILWMGTILGLDGTLWN